MLKLRGTETRMNKKLFSRNVIIIEYWYMEYIMSSVKILKNTNKITFKSKTKAYLQKFKLITEIILLVLYLEFWNLENILKGYKGQTLYKSILKLLFRILNVQSFLFQTLKICKNLSYVIKSYTN